MLEQGPIIVAYRRRVTEDDEYSYQIQDKVQMTAEYAMDNEHSQDNQSEADQPTAKYRQSY